MGRCCCAPYTSLSPGSPETILRGITILIASAGGYGSTSTFSGEVSYSFAIACGVSDSDAHAAL
jgi:hypothetical protein